MLFDNFDRFVESKNGKDTLHDTVSVPYELVFPELSGSFDGKINDKSIRQKTRDDPETYTRTSSSAPVKSKTGTSVADFSNAKNSASIADNVKTKLEVVEKSKNKKRRPTYKQGGLDIGRTEKNPKLNDPDILYLDNPQQISTHLIEEKKVEAWKKDIMWMADIVTDDENSTPTWVSLNSNLFLKDDETQNLVFAINKHVPNIPCIRC